MNKHILTIAMLLTSIVMFGAPQAVRLLVLGDDPMMVSDEAAGSVGYATKLQPLFDDMVTVEVMASAALLPDDADALLEPAMKGDVVMLCKRPVAAEVEDKVVTDIYLDQLVAIAKAAKKKGVKVIWLTQGCPRYFTAEGVQVHRGGVYPEVVRRMCQRDEAMLVDVEQLMFEHLTEIGQEASAAEYVALEAANPAAAEKAAREGNLLTDAGAEAVAAIIGAAIRADKQNVLSKNIRK